MADRMQFYPQSLLDDETVQSGTESPEQWIVTDDGKYHLNDDPEMKVLTPLEDGQIVNFVTCIEHGMFDIVMNDDGTWTMPHGESAPATFGECCIMNGWQADTQAVSIQTCVDQFIEACGEGDDNLIGFFTWSDPIPYRFDQASRRFIRVADEVKQ